MRDWADEKAHELIFTKADPTSPFASRDFGIGRIADALRKAHAAGRKAGLEEAEKIATYYADCYTSAHPLEESRVDTAQQITGAIRLLVEEPALSQEPAE